MVSKKYRNCFRPGENNLIKPVVEVTYLQAFLFRFAIDWNEDEQVVRLMLGKVGQIVCTLKIHEGYPSTGEISVVEIHGADPAVIFQDNLVSVFSEVLLSPPYLTLCDLRKQTFSIGESVEKCTNVLGEIIIRNLDMYKNQYVIKPS